MNSPTSNAGTKGQLGPAPKTPDMLPREYTREALKRGLAYEATLGVNPFKFGLIGSSDSHTSLATTTEDNFFGKVAPSNRPRIRSVSTRSLAASAASRTSFSMPARPRPPVSRGVVTRQYPRSAVGPMARKEVYATTGTRLRVRVFGGFGFTRKDLERSDFAAQGYQRGVPMGGDLKAAPAGQAQPL